MTEFLASMCALLYMGFFLGAVTSDKMRQAPAMAVLIFSGLFMACAQMARLFYGVLS